MKVKHLVDFLKKKDPDMEVIFDDAGYGLVGITEAQLIEVEDYGEDGYGRPYSGTNVGEHPRVTAIIIS